MSAETSKLPPHDGWTIDGAEALLATLPGVLSARVVGRPGGDVQEIHLLTTEEVSPKQTVRNVESALLAHFDLSFDHRKISVAQSRDKDGNEGVAAAFEAASEEAERPEERILFLGHQAESESSRLTAQVAVEWRGERFTGEAVGPQIADEGREGVALALDGVKLVDAFDRRFVLVAVHAIRGRNVTALAGSAGVEDSTDRAVILATLQATDRWVRGRVK